MSTGILSEADGLSDQHADMQACPGARAQEWVTMQQEAKAIIYLPNDTRIVTTVSKTINQQNGPC